MKKEKKIRTIFNENMGNPLKQLEELCIMASLLKRKATENKASGRLIK